ncbi:MAG TPA: hypothetical protein VFW87_18515 [Pirellulales bacterium]|nr:hypothetical protein [Pirellulales bacterium]
MAINKRSKSNGAEPRAKPTVQSRWFGRLGMYHCKRAIKFETKQDLHQAIDAIWDPRDELFRMPHAPADGLTMIVPVDAVPLFRARQFRFTEYPVMPAVRLPPHPKGSSVA